MNLPTLSKKQINRLNEIKFYLFVTKLDKVFKATVSQYSNLDIITILAELAQVDPMDIENIIILLKKQQNIPTKEEVVLTAKYLNLGYRFVSKNLISQRTVQKISDELKNKNEQTVKHILEQRLSNEQTELVTRLNEFYEEYLKVPFDIMGAIVKPIDNTLEGDFA